MTIVVRITTRTLPDNTWNKITENLSSLGEGKFVQLASSLEAQKISSLEDHALMFADALATILRTRAGQSLLFDKDDSLLLGFVAAAAALRMANYNIPLVSLWETKTIAGAIQPAIAATNATVAALQAMVGLRMLKLLASKQDVTLKELSSRHASYVSWEYTLIRIFFVNPNALRIMSRFRLGFELTLLPPG